MDTQALHVILNRYALDSAKKLLEDCDDSALQIALIGEFSSGKSSLVNALIGRTLLPTLPRPTSRTTVTVYQNPDLSEFQCFSVSNEGEKTAISALDFQSAATSSQSNDLMLEIPPTETFPPDFWLVDTPGLAALDQADQIRTFALLSWLDGVILCQDIQQGRLPGSVVKFLNQPMLRAMRSRTLVVLTHADTKPDATIQAVVDGIQQQFAELPGDGADANAVVAVDAKHAVYDATLVQPVRDGFERVFRAQKHLMRKQQNERHFVEAASRSHDMLRDLAASASNSDDSALLNQINENRKRIDALKDQRQALVGRLKSLERHLQQKLITIANSHAPHIVSSAADGQGEHEGICKQLVEEIAQATQDITGKYFSEIRDVMDSIHPSAGTLIYEMQWISKSRNFGVMLSTSVLTAVLIPGGAVLGNATQAGGGAAAVSISGKLAKPAAAAAAAAAAKQAAIKSAAKKVLIILAYVIRDVNPMEHLGTFIARKASEQPVEVILRSLVNTTVQQTLALVEDELAQTVFMKLERELTDRNQQFGMLITQRKTAAEDYAKWQNQLDIDIRWLSAAAAQGASEHAGSHE